MYPELDPAGMGSCTMVKRNRNLSPSPARERGGAAARGEVTAGTFDDLLKVTPSALQPLVKRLREVILEAHPGACEVVRLGDRAATYGLGPKKMTEGYGYLQPHDAWVNVGFYQGAALPDPTGLLEGTGARMRHVKVRALDEAERPALRALLRASLAERTKALGR
jgi:hypothetical protein